MSKKNVVLVLSESSPQVAYDPVCDAIHVERDNVVFEIKVTDEGIIVDVYSSDDGEFLDSPFSATWGEMIPGDDNTAS